LRQVIIMMQTTLNNRIAKADGTFWEPFAWGDPEMAVLNPIYAAADTWVMSRPIYEAVAPWWDIVARGEIPADVHEVSAVDQEFGQIFGRLRRIVISHWKPDGADVVWSGDIAAKLMDLKSEDGADIILSAGPAVLDPLLREPALVDRLVLAVHPAILGDGPRLFGDAVDRALHLRAATSFEAGALLLDYAVLYP
jgi:dihydrofolate reductase